LLQMLADSLRTPSDERVVMWPIGLGADGRTTVKRFFEYHEGALRQLRLDVERPRSEAEPFLVLHGPHALPLARLEAGVHLFRPPHAAVEPVQVIVLPLNDGAEAQAVVRDWQSRRESWLEALSRGVASVDDDPLNPGPVLRIYAEKTGDVDLRTGLTGHV